MAAGRARQLKPRGAPPLLGRRSRRPGLVVVASAGQRSLASNACLSSLLGSQALLSSQGLHDARPGSLWCGCLAGLPSQSLLRSQGLLQDHRPRSLRGCCLARLATQGLLHSSLRSSGQTELPSRALLQHGSLQAGTPLLLSRLLLLWPLLGPANGIWHLSIQAGGAPRSHAAVAQQPEEVVVALSVLHVLVAQHAAVGAQPGGASQRPHGEPVPQGAGWQGHQVLQGRHIPIQRSMELSHCCRPCRGLSGRGYGGVPAIALALSTRHSLAAICWRCVCVIGPCCRRWRDRITSRLALQGVAPYPKGPVSRGWANIGCTKGACFCAWLPCLQVQC